MLASSVYPLVSNSALHSMKSNTTEPTSLILGPEDVTRYPRSLLRVSKDQKVPGAGGTCFEAVTLGLGGRLASDKVAPSLIDIDIEL